MTTKALILKAIRTKCIDCAAGNRSEVARCHIETCSLWPFRFGADPNPQKSIGFAKPHATAGSFEQEDPL